MAPTRTTGLFTDDARGAWLTTEATGVRRFRRHALTTGIEYRNDIQQNQSAADETGIVLNDRRGSQTVGIYAEDELRISSHVLLNAGVRFDDYFDTFGTTVNPRVALVVSPYYSSARTAAGVSPSTRGVNPSIITSSSTAR